MLYVAKFLIGLVLALTFAGSATVAVGATVMTVKDAISSNGSLESFEARIRHYTDRLVSDEEGFRFVHVPHPFLQHFGMILIAWSVAIVTAIALRKLEASMRSPRSRMR